MIRAVATMTADGRLSIPAAVRRRLGLARGSTVLLEDRDTESFVLRSIAQTPGAQPG